MFKFLKLHACGNNFLIFFNNKKKILIKKFLNKKSGISCDQLLIIKFVNYKFKIINIKIYNNNLNEAKNCGNGIRCLSWFFLKKNNEKLFLNFNLNNNFIYAYKKKKYIYTVYKFPNIVKKIFLRIKNIFLKTFFVDLINLHLVIIIKTFFNKIIKNIIYKIKKFFGDIYNIEFLKILNKNNLYIRIFEKNVGETFSCGSGIISSSYVIYLKYFKFKKIKINSIGGFCYINIFYSNLIIYGKTNFCYFGYI